MLVAQQPSPDEVFTAATEEVGHLLGADLSTMLVYPGDGTATTIARWGEDDEILPVGTRLPLDADTVVGRVFETSAPARVDTYDDVDGQTAQVAQEIWLRSTIGAPIMIDGRLWGALAAATRGTDHFPAGAEERIGAFTELVATAVANAEARGEIERLASDLRRLADQQAALRRVATLVAQNVSAGELLSGVAGEVGRLLDVRDVMIERFEEDRAVVTLASADEDAWPVGRRWELDGVSTSAAVFDTGRPARIGDYAGLPGTIAAEVRRSQMRSSVGVPIVVGDRLWGVMCVGVRADETLPPETEGRLTEFTDLVATAISNADARDNLHTLAAEHAALRRLATLVAERTPTGDLYTAVAEEVGQLLDVATVNLVRYDAGDTMTVLASLHNPPFPVGSTWPLEGDSVTSQVFESGRAVRVDDYSERHGPIADATRSSPITSSVGVPIVVGGTLWGMLAVGGTEPLREGIETRLRDFTELVATAVSDATTRAELIASRARLVTAGDEARRRIERNLHDGTQQRLVTVDIGLRALESKLGGGNPEARELVERIRGEIGAVIAEVREVSRGLHPSALAEAGLASSLRSLARRSGIGVDLEVDLPDRPPEPIEIGVYYLVSEALTNIVKHARAQSVTIVIGAAGSTLSVAVADDGVGGARMDRGSGLEGLVDRVEALGGRLTIESPPARGTRILAVLPLDGAGKTRANARVTDGRDTRPGGAGFVPSSDPGEGD